MLQGRRARTVLVGVVFLGGIIGVFQQHAHGQKDAAAVTPADYLHWRATLKNWGRWGPTDQKGTANLITPAKVLNAVRLVKSGLVVSMAHAVVQAPAADVDSARVFHRTTISLSDTGTMDNYQVSYHGFALAHTDAFCHFFFDGQMYNGYPVKDNISPEAGCKQGDIMARRDGIVTRAVLYDMPQLKGVDWIEPGTPIARADLEAWERKSGVKVGPGDVILLYVGRWKRRAAVGPHMGIVAGYYADTIPFFKERDIAFAGHDFNIDWSPRPGWGPEQGIPGNPIHQALLNWLGAGIVENLDLEQVVETARRLKRYEFMMTFAPIPVEGGTGSPLNPLAVF
ncbi:MAG: cyclase family protein [Acidobacteriota bacterium]